MKLIVDYDLRFDSLQEELDYLELRFSLPTFFYIRAELNDYKVEKYKLIGKIRKEQEYESAFRNSNDSSR